LKIGLYGGTFDPIHNGHLRVVVELIARKVVDQIVLIPAGEPQLRQSPPKADGTSRVQMCKLAISDLPAGIKESVTVNELEINRDGPSYAIDTVESLMKEQNSDANEYFWIIGSDAYQKIEQWHRAKELQELVSFIVIDRPGDSAAEDLDGLDIGALDISATQIRNDVSVNGVSPSVRKFIMDRKLYASK
jgi:nicotinate-nucleotide adenylyltransferase